MAMGREKSRAISRKGLDASFEKEERHKSHLILEANLLKKQQRHQEAADKFAEAARIEERLSEVVAEKGLTDKYFVHRFSAASCWAQAGNVYQAIAMCNELLKHPDLPQRLRQRVEEYLQVLQARREQWVIQQVPDLAAAVPPES
jgi:tetratricopeptide (TPR) repeat protein